MDKIDIQQGTDLLNSLNVYPILKYSEVFDYLREGPV